MSLFVCEKCGNIENTATSFYWTRKDGEPALCSVCDPKFPGNGIDRGKYDGSQKVKNPEIGKEFLENN